MGVSVGLFFMCLPPRRMLCSASGGSPSTYLPRGYVLRFSCIGFLFRLLLWPVLGIYLYLVFGRRLACFFEGLCCFDFGGLFCSRFWDGRSPTCYVLWFTTSDPLRLPVVPLYVGAFRPARSFRGVVRDRGRVVFYRPILPRVVHHGLLFPYFRRRLYLQRGSVCLVRGREISHVVVLRG